MTNSEYEYTRVPLTPAIATKLIQELFASRTVERHIIVDAVVRVHKERGGIDGKAKDTPRMVKKALAMMEKHGLASNPSFGHWRINPLIANFPTEQTQFEPERTVEQITVAPIAERVIGDGEQSVYLYYFESYRRLAELEGKLEFQCKIGRSERDPLLRVLSQASTALPEYPKIALLLKTDDGASLETAIHSILCLRGKEVDDSPGTEWFLTSPSEVEEIVKFIGEVKQHHQPAKSQDLTNNAVRSALTPLRNLTDKETPHP